MSDCGALFAGLVVAGVFPCSVGALCLAPWLSGRVGDRMVAVGLVYPTGATLISSAMLVLGLVEIRLDRASIAALAMSLAAILGAVAWRRLAGPNARREGEAMPPSELPLPVTFGLGALVVSKLSFVFFDVVRKPIEVWDAFAVWTLRAKVWSARQSLVLDPADPFYLGGGARTDYPPHVSLLHAWVAIGIGEWNDVLVNLPWAFYYASAVVLVFAVLRRSFSTDWGLVAAVGLSGLPLFVIHASHAGYADGILAVHFLAFCALSYLADRQRGRADADGRASLVLCVGFLLSLPLVKFEGVVLMVAGVLGLAARGPRATGKFRLRRVLVLLLVGTAALGFALFNAGIRDYISSTHFHAQAVLPVLLDLFAQGNWNLLWFVFWALVVLRMRSPSCDAAGRLALVVAMPVVPFLYVLWCTDAWHFAAGQTADSRLFLTLAPSALLFVVIAAAKAWCRPRSAAAVPRELA